jgi:CheY-like chemotaxis protein
MSPLVLVVDDDPDILEAVSEILEGEGYRVARAANGAEALARVEAERPGAILLDLVMPVMDGFAFARTLRARAGAPVPVVVISADGSPDRAADLDAYAYLAKPFDVDALLARVAAAIAAGSGRSAAGG